MDKSDIGYFHPYIYKRDIFTPKRDTRTPKRDPSIRDLGRFYHPYTEVLNIRIECPISQNH